MEKNLIYNQIVTENVCINNSTLNSQAGNINESTFGQDERTSLPCSLVVVQCFRNPRRSNLFHTMMMIKGDLDTFNACYVSIQKQRHQQQRDKGKGHGL